jgi:hypothetical protein
VTKGFISVNTQAPSRGKADQREFLRRGKADQREYGTMDIFNSATIVGITANASSSPLEFIGNLYEVNMILKTLKYQSDLYMNGYDYIHFSAYEIPGGSESNRMVEESLISNTTLRVFIVPVNNPPVIILTNISLGFLYDDNVTIRHNTENSKNMSGYTSVGVIRFKEGTTYPIGVVFFLYLCLIAWSMFHM